MHLRNGILALAIMLHASFAANAGDIPVDEAPLDYAVLLYEVNRNAAGKLYVTDWGGGLIWRVDDPTTGAYSRFGVGGAPNDARPDSAGDIWFTDYYSRRLGRISAGANPSLTAWYVDTSRSDYNLAGLAVDDNDRVWFSEFGGPEQLPEPLLYRFDPANNNQLCTYTLPDSGNSSYYVLYAGGFVWLSDSLKGRIVRLNPDPRNLQATYWSLSAGSEPRGLAIDASGNIWWADQSSNELGRLEVTQTNINRITTYSLPRVSTIPQMVAARDGKIWYTAYGKSAAIYGILDPDLARKSYSYPNPVPQPATATCAPLGEGTPTSMSHGTEPLLGWSTDVLWTDITPSGAGWTVYEAAGGGYPYGILAETARVWVTDQQHQVSPRLVRIIPVPQVAIRIPTGTTNVELTWKAVAGATLYHVWYSTTDPYFASGGTLAPDPVNSDLTFTHTGAAANPIQLLLRRAHS